LTALTISISSAQTVNNAHPDNNVLVEYDPSRSIPPPPPSKIYKVGDSKGWSVSQESDFYFKWAEERHFDIGDNLFF